MNTFIHIQRYCDLWMRGEMNRPLVILIGGYAGTGKTTLAKQMGARFPHAQVLQTAILRSLLRMVIDRNQNPFLHVHTYDLAKVDIGQRQTSLQDRYRAQVEPVTRLINEIVNFAGTERQQRIIEGTQLLPDSSRPVHEVILAEIYLKVSDPQLHRRMMAGPTHNRTVTDEQFATARMLHDFIVHEAMLAGKEVYESHKAYAESMRYVDDLLQTVLEVRDS